MSSCQRCSSDLEVGDLQCPVCSLATPPPPSRTEEAQAQILRCDECGAAVTFDAEAAAPKCRFCAATMSIETPVDPVESPEHIVPFAVDREGAQRAVKAWLSSHRGFFQPGDLATHAAIDQLAQVLWCAWIVDAEAHITWTADSDQGSGRSSWAPHAGSEDLSFKNLIVPASRGLTLDECQLLAANYNLATARPFEQDARSVEAFDMQRSAARKVIQRGIDATAASRVRVPGSSVRNFRNSTLVRKLRTRRFGLPAYIIAYRYSDRVYRVIVHGQKSSVVTGTMPRSAARILAAIAIGILLLVLLVVVLRHQ